ncbi:MAG: dockerin type I repeat-containing protein, partial [Fidelibacterota bacterium]
SDTTLNIDMKWAGKTFIESFDDLDNWDVLDGFWNTQFGYLSSQAGLLYPDLHQSQIESGSILIPGNNNFELVMDLKYELEWENDTAFVKFVTETEEYVMNRTLQNWEFHREYFPVENVTGDTGQLFIGLHTDSNVEYRGIQIDNLELWYEPEVDCPLADLNRDGITDVLDIVSIVDGIMSDSFTGYQLCSADVTGDGQTDVLDIVYVIMVILIP